MMRHLTSIANNGYSIMIPHPKVRSNTNQYLVLLPRNDPSCPIAAINLLLSALPDQSPDRRLWQLPDGVKADRHWFNTIMEVFLPRPFDCSSFRAGGATHLASIGTPTEIIRNLGRWKSCAWELYIRAHPQMLSHALHEPESIMNRLSQLSMNDQVITENLQSLSETCLRLGDQLTRLTEAWGSDQARELIPMANPLGYNQSNNSE